MDPQDRKLTLPAFLKVLTSNNVPVPKAMAVASKVYKESNTASLLAQLTDLKLKVSGVEDKETRKLVLAAVRKAGYIAQPLRPGSEPKPKSDRSKRFDGQPVVGPSEPRVANAVQVVVSPLKRKRKRDDDLLNELLPDGPPDEAAAYGSLEFNEVLDETVLNTKFTVVNRAPLMTAWATVVAERLGFEREEALSIASVYTEMNAISKGVSLGLFDKSREKEIEPIKDSTQPYVDLLGRRPLYRTQNETWRALDNTSPALPSTAFSYISRAFRQTTPYVIGALRLLAESFPPPELNNKGFGLYAEFRPDVDGWGKRGEVRCEQILSLRKKDRSTVAETAVKGDVVKLEANHDSRPAQGAGGIQSGTSEGPEHKKARTMTLEEYEAALDQDDTFDDVDLNFEF
ncbi:uncharacterized protein F5891DRAFT_940717 [Suillus fuscotomentosus]|uniref:Uncharacterized protein n=1 Tax=Suillus fuscotomentosus TaxID=1912939 RepID=A0AAD4HS85_9AGAM|nr:uncharacterized protein F5891DRAFT_940717 [Suillus fuscotomentosus]KAG1907108.1 hypothetical protein F5891DRAFT_940717 [Suillus fuscotomentosus]